MNCFAICNPIMGAASSVGTLKAAPIPSNADFYPKYEGQGPFFACNPDALSEPRLALTGPGGPDTAPTTMMQVLDLAVKRQGNRTALAIERPCPPVTDGIVAPALMKEDW